MYMFTGQTNQSFIFVQCWEKFHHHSSIRVCVCCVCMCVSVSVCVCVCEREEGSDHAATIKSSPWKKVAVNSEIELFIKYIR